MKTKRITASLLALAAFCGTTACGGEKTKPETTTTSGETTIQTPEYNLPERKDLGGREFTILAAGGRSELFDAEQTGDVVDDAAHQRKLDTEDHLGIKINFIEKDSGWRVAAEFSQTITSAVMSGDDTYDLMSGAMTVIPKLAMSGNFLDITKLPVDLSNPWWVGRLADTVGINGRLYSFVGDMSTTMYNAAAVVYYNKKLHTDYSLPDLYRLVNDGKWTVDEMLSLSKNISSDLNGDGEITRDDDLIAISGHFTPFATIQASCGINIFEKENGIPVFLGQNERLISVCEKFTAAVSDKTFYIKNGDEYEVWAKSFMEDRNLFQFSTLRVASTLRGMESDFGILPFPKYDENQENYVSDVSQSTVLWCVPVTAKDPELTSEFCEVFAYYSRNDVIPAYYEKALQGKYSRDSETGEMLDLIRSGLRLTLDGYLNHCFSVNPFNTTAKLIESGSDVSSYFAKNSESWKADLDAIIKAYN